MNCTLQPCDRMAERGRTVCATHRWRLARGLELHDETRVQSKAEMDRLWSSLRVDMGQDCIEWPGSRNSNGYGRTSRHGQVIASRAVWIEMFGPIPEAMVVCHRCDNPPCVNPGHLFLGTLGDNARDRNAKGRNVDNNGVRNAQARLSGQDVADIRSAYDAGEPGTAIAVRYGVSKAHIYNILSFKRRAVA